MKKKVLEYSRSEAIGEAHFLMRTKDWLNELTQNLTGFEVGRISYDLDLNTGNLTKEEYDAVLTCRATRDIFRKEAREMILERKELPEDIMRLSFKGDPKKEASSYASLTYEKSFHEALFSEKGLDDKGIGYEKARKILRLKENNWLYPYFPDVSNFAPQIDMFNLKEFSFSYFERFHDIVKVSLSKMYKSEFLFEGTDLFRINGLENVPHIVTAFQKHDIARDNILCTFDKSYLKKYIFPELEHFDVKKLRLKFNKQEPLDQTWEGRKG